MKRIILGIVGVITLASCSTQKKSGTDSNNGETRSIGGQKDKHGCLVAAGQSWSEVKQNCIQVFNDGIRLDPVVKKENEAVFSAFVVYPTDRSKAELFLPDQDKTVILTTNDKKIYSSGKYSYNSTTGTLSINGVKTFQTVR